MVFQIIPEPSTILLFASDLGAMAVGRRRGALSQQPSNPLPIGCTLAGLGRGGDCAEIAFDDMSRRLMVIFRDSEAGEVGS